MRIVAGCRILGRLGSEGASAGADQCHCLFFPGVSAPKMVIPAGKEKPAPASG
jgi:hypothetical protein